MESLTIFCLFFIYLVYYLESYKIDEEALKGSIFLSSISLIGLMLMVKPDNDLFILCGEFMLSIMVGFFYYMIRALKIA